jgi:hypothetical protein
LIITADAYCVAILHDDKLSPAIRDRDRNHAKHKKKKDTKKKKKNQNTKLFDITCHGTIIAIEMFSAGIGYRGGGVARKEGGKL